MQDDDARNGNESVGHLEPEELRRLGHRMVDFIVDYWQRVESFPVRSPVSPGEITSQLPVHPPEQGFGGAAGWDAVFEDLERLIMPGLTHWQSPNFFAYFPSNASGPAVLGEMLSAGLGVQGMLWSTSPACTELETRMLDWLGELLGLPASFSSTSPSGGGVIQGTASEAELVAMVAARERVRRVVGRDDEPLVVYASTQAHSAIQKAALIAGVTRSLTDEDRLCLVSTDDRYAMRPDLLERAITEDLARGRRPFFVVATLGTTSSGAFDDLVAIRAALDRTGFSGYGGWLHVDAAWAGSAFVCPELRGPLAGIEAADSFAVNPHKWLLVNFDCDAFYTRDRDSVLAALSVTPEYLRNAASGSGAVIDYRDWQIPLGRRFRALKLWFVMRHYGAEGLRAHIRRHVRMAERFSAWVAEDKRFEVLGQSLSLVCLRLVPRGGESAEAVDTKNRELLERVNAPGRVFLTHTVLAGVDGAAARYVLRVAIGATNTEERHVRACWEEITRAADHDA